MYMLICNRLKVYYYINLRYTNSYIINNFKEAKMVEKYEVVDSIESLQNTITRVRKAQEEFSKFSQEKVDQILKLLQLQQIKQEYLLHKWQQKKLVCSSRRQNYKNHYAAEYIYNKYKNEKTVELLKKITIMA